MPACGFCQEDWTDDDVGVMVESAATIMVRNMGSENSREFSQDSETTPGESVVSSDEEPDVIAQSREAPTKKHVRSDDRTSHRLELRRKGAFRTEILRTQKTLATRNFHKSCE